MHAAKETAPAADKKSADNPLLTESTLPYQMPPFDKIRSEHFLPAFAVALPEHLKEVEAIANSKEEPTFENTIVALDKRRAHADPRREYFFESGRRAYESRAPEGGDRDGAEAGRTSGRHPSEHRALSTRVQLIYDRREQLGLDPESRYLLDRYYKDFVHAGAKLAEPEKKKLKAMNAELASLQTKFSQDVLKEKNASAVLVTDRRGTGGLARQRDRGRGHRRQRTTRRKASFSSQCRTRAGSRRCPHCKIAPCANGS